MNVLIAIYICIPCTIMHMTFTNQKMKCQFNIIVFCLIKYAKEQINYKRSDYSVYIHIKVLKPIYQLLLLIM